MGACYKEHTPNKLRDAVSKEFEFLLSKGFSISDVLKLLLVELLEVLVELSHVFVVVATPAVSVADIIEVNFWVADCCAVRHNGNLLVVGTSLIACRRLKDNY